MNTFFYDGQIRRYMLQFQRVFSFLKYQTRDANNVITENEVPIVQGDMTRQVGAILNNNSENNTLPGTVMSYYITEISPQPERRRDPSFEGIVNIVEQKIRQDAPGELESYDRGKAGNKYTVNRYMPSPYDLVIQLDIAASSTDVKLQILEQIMTVFNPDIVIQQNDNIIDWSAITSIKLENVTYTNRTIGSQIDSEKDFASLTFRLPVWINPPAKVQRMRIIEKIVQNLHEAPEIPDIELNKWYDPIRFLTDFKEISTIVYTTDELSIRIGVDNVKSDQIQLLKDGSPVSWHEQFKDQGGIDEYTLIIFNPSGLVGESEYDISARVSPIAHRPDLLDLQIDVDTLPSTTQAPVNSIINPQLVNPAALLPEDGDRYLLTEDILYDHSGPWGGFVANQDNIIEYRSGNWYVVFDGSEKIEFVTAADTGQHFKYALIDNVNYAWSYTYLAEYAPELWRMTKL